MAETKVPRLSAVNAGQNWRAADVESLWASPMVGVAGTTAGEALVAMLEPDGDFIRQVDGLGQGLSGDGGVFGLPILGAWLSGRCCQAYHRGFVEPLANDPKRAILGLLPRAEESSGGVPNFAYLGSERLRAEASV